MKDFLQKYKAMISMIIVAIVLIIAGMLHINVNQDDVTKAVNSGIDIVAPPPPNTPAVAVPANPGN